LGELVWPGAAALDGSQHFQGIAHEVQLAFSHLIGVEDEVLGLGTVGEDELGALLLYSPARIDREVALAVIERESQATAVEAG
jgi:hypothetical protein